MSSQELTALVRSIYTPDGDLYGYFEQLKRELAQRETHVDVEKQRTTVIDSPVTTALASRTRTHMQNLMLPPHQTMASFPPALRDHCDWLQESGRITQTMSAAWPDHMASLQVLKNRFPRDGYSKPGWMGNLRGKVGEFALRRIVEDLLGRNKNIHRDTLTVVQDARKQIHGPGAYFMQYKPPFNNILMDGRSQIGEFDLIVRAEQQPLHFYLFDATLSQGKDSGKQDLSFMDFREQFQHAGKGNIDKIHVQYTEDHYHSNPMLSEDGVYWISLGILREVRQLVGRSVKDMGLDGQIYPDAHRNGNGDGNGRSH